MRDHLGMQPWDVVIPVKGGPAGKSRLGAPQLALAMAVDCVQACLACAAVGRVRVVAGGPEAAVAVMALDGSRLQVVLQPAGRPGLTAAVQRGLDACSGATAVLLADLPALQPADLAAALEQLGDGVGFVPDREGTGTVLLGGPTPELAHRFGPDSAQAHEAAGAHRHEVELPRLRTDVDTPADLLAALELGVGGHTRAKVSGVQATVLSFDPSDRSGEVVLDDGLALPFEAVALNGSGLRQLRPGQRVSIAVPPEQDRVLAVRINGIGEPLQS